MKIENYSETLHLTGETIDIISEKAQGLLKNLKTEKANILRIRLSLEEALLRYLDKFGEKAFVTVNIGKRFRRPYISFEIEGEAYNPIENAENEFGTWSDSLLSSIDLKPEYSYSRGKNTVTFKLNRPHKNPAISLVYAVAMGMIIGLLGKYFLSPDILADVVKTVLQPVNDLFFRLLNLVSGPVIFLSVAAAICGMGNIASIGKNGRGMVLRFILISFVITVISCMISVPLFKLNYINNPLNGTEFSSVLDLFLNVIPNDICVPFITGESPQLIFMAFILGNALLLLGKKSEGLTNIVEQSNNIALVIAEWLSRFVPYFVFLLLILEIWLDSASAFIGIWQPTLIFVSISALFAYMYISYVCKKKKVKFSLIIKKILPSFKTALKTASVESAYGENVICCEKKLGMGKPITSYALPLGLIMFMPAGSIAMLNFTLYAAHIYNVPVSPVFFIFAVFLTVILMIADPPVSSVTLLAYTAIFTELGIPSKALAVAMVANIIFSFFTSALNQTMLQMELILQADKSGMLNTEILRKE